MTDATLPELEELWTRATPPQVQRHLTYPETSMVEQFRATVQRHIDRPALDFFGKRTSYREFGSQVERVAARLVELGVRPGHRVALLMPTCPQHVIAFYAVLMAGATVVEHNPLYTTDELTPMFADHGAKVAIVWDAAAQVIQDLPEDVRPPAIISVNMVEAMPATKRALLSLPVAKVKTTRAQLTKPAPGTLPWRTLLKKPDPAAVASLASATPTADDDALILYTSGTSGQPKGVPLSHRNLNATAVMSLEWVWNMVPGQEVFLAVLPLFHVFGCSLSMNAGLQVGAMLHLVPKPEPSLMLDACKRAMPTMIIAVPPIFDRLADTAAQKGVSLKGVRTGISGAMPLTPELIGKWESATGGLLIEGYGLSETSPILAGNPVAPTRKAGSIGIPFPDTQLRLVDPENPDRDVPWGEPGEIVVKGPQVFRGYRNRPEETAAAFHDGWFRTGDVAVADQDGFLKIVDRLKEIVITGGFNVYPSEVEDALRKYDGIKDAAVVGLVNDLGSEEVVAAVVLADGHSVDVDEMRARIKQHLTAYKVPRKLFVMPELPRNAMGKVLRREVQAAVEKMREEARGVGETLRETSHELAEKGQELAAKGGELVDKVKSAVGKDDDTPPSSN